MTTVPDGKKRRSNEQILADAIAARKEPVKRVRRTKEQIAKDNEKKRLAEEAAKPKPFYRVVEFYAEVNAFGKLWQPGEVVELKETSYYYTLAFDKNDDFILDKTESEQLKLWGKVRYRIREELL